MVRHPERREAPPLAPEPVARTGGDRRNGCGRNAAARSVDDLRRERPHLRAIVPQDGPASNGPHIARLRRHGLRSVPGAKPGGHALPADGQPGMAVQPVHVRFRITPSLNRVRPKRLARAASGSLPYRMWLQLPI